MSDDCNNMAAAEGLCKQRGVRLTPQRHRVLAIVCASDKPLGAYDILQIMQNEQPRIAPPTVYRALDFLLEQGLVHKLETLHAFVGCSHPEYPHGGQFLICTGCGEVTELDDRRIEHSVGQAARASGFVPDQEIIEVAGRCADCRADKS